MRKTNSELAILERGQFIFTNLEKQPEISGVMAEYGYSEEVLAEGRLVFDKARACYDASRQEAIESKEAYQLFADFKARIDARYRMLRKKAKVLYRNHPLMIQRLNVHGDTPAAYLNWLDCVQQFCNVFLSSEEVQSRLARLKVTVAEVEELQLDIDSLITSRAGYIKERGEAQHATQLKDDAIAHLDRWIREFYWVAKIALDDQPQLLETFGIVVKR
ncbi:hypothetical protein [Carboxylicivirga sp. RSCT41]|uniref:hypothetical protein n=1 Tax=Carboxylicivirga agarovorans TaxID=3417570 RepID=UPI003D335CD2